MTWPTTPIETTALDGDLDRPPREVVLAMAEAVNLMIDSPPDPGSGRLLAVNVMDLVGGGTFSFGLPGIRWVVAELWGAGGGGAGVDTPGAGMRRLGQGGGAGAFVRASAAVVPASDGSVQFDYTVGGGGAGGSSLGGAGANGQATQLSFNTSGVVWSMVAGGGVGGAQGSAFDPAQAVFRDGSPGGAASVGGSAVLHVSRVGESARTALSLGSGSAFGGDGASGFGRGGGGGRIYSAADVRSVGASGLGIGAGGGGAAANGAVAGVTGGNGARGHIVVYAYAW